MIILQNETRRQIVENETVNGINVTVNLKSSVLNDEIPDTNYNQAVGFDAANVSVEVSLMRNGKKTEIIPGKSLALLANFYTILKSSDQWQKGLIVVDKGAASYQQVQRTLFIPFHGHINLKGDDQMIITVQVNRGTYNAGVDASASTIKVEQNQSIGVGMATYKFESYAIQANQDTESINLGDNVERVALVSFSKTQLKPIFKSASLSSDRLDWTKNEAELWLQHLQNFDNVNQNAPNRYGANVYPENRLLHLNNEIDRAKINVRLQPNNVVASENYICWISFTVNADDVTRGNEMLAKHHVKNMEKILL